MEGFVTGILKGLTDYLPRGSYTPTWGYVYSALYVCLCEELYVSVQRLV